MLEKKEKSLREIIEEVFQEQEQEIKRTTAIAAVLNFLHPRYYRKMINDKMDEKNLWYLLEQLTSKQRAELLILLKNQKLEAFLMYILQERKEESFKEWLDEMSEEDFETLKKKFLELLAFMKNREEIVLQCIPNSWMDEAVEEIMEKIAIVFSRIPDNLAIQILLQCNEENFSTICEQLAGSDFFCYEDVAIENQIAFLQKLKRCNVEIDLFLPSYVLIASYKVAKSDEKKTILLDIIADMEQEMQECILTDLYDALDKKEKLDLLEMVSDEKNEEEKFLAKKIIAVQLKKILENKQRLEEKVFLGHFQTWLNSSLLNNE